MRFAKATGRKIARVKTMDKQRMEEVKEGVGVEESFMKKLVRS